MPTDNVPLHAQPAADAAQPRVALIGAFDVLDLGEQVRRRVVTAELQRRLPSALIRWFAPFGWLRPSALDGGEPAEPLGAWSEENATEIARQFDLIVLCTAMDVDQLRAAYELSAQEFSERGVGQWLTDMTSWSPAAAVTLASWPDPARLAHRVFPPDVLERRVRFLRHLGWFPAVDEALLFDSTVAAPDALVAAGRDSERVVLLDFPRGAATHFGLCHHIAASASLEDAVAAVAASRVVVTTDSGLTALARAYARPVGPTLDTAGGGPAGPDSVISDLDSLFDDLAANVLAVADVTPESEGSAEDRWKKRVDNLEHEVTHLRAALIARGQTLAAERRRMGDRLDELTKRVDGRPWIVRAIRKPLRPLRRRWQRSR